MIVYRGATPIDVEAAVIRGDETIGVIAEVHVQPAAQRVVVALRDAGLLRRGDRYLPYKTGRGVGFKVAGGGGEALTNGDVVEAGFALRAGDDARGSVVPLPGEQPASLSDNDKAAPRSRRDDLPAGPVPPWNLVRPQNDLQSAGIVAQRFEHVPRPLLQRSEEIVVQARGRSPDEAEVYITRELIAIGGEFEAALRDARERGDKAAIPEIRQLQIRTERLLHRLRLQASANARRP